MGLDVVNPPAFARDPAFTVGLPQDPTFLATLEAILDARYAPAARGMALVASVTVSSDQTGIGASSTPLTGFTSTFTAIAGRRYFLSFILSSSNQTAGGARHTFDWALGGTDQAIIAVEDANGSTSVARTHSGLVDMGVLGAGGRTITITGRTSAGTMTIHSSSVNNGRMIILDSGA